ncbi:SDR family oxidoreductase [Alphaproteobacteria bacterium]|nr:SDR family oxidoreductase [Alphaproteobacteria bacterium]MDC0476525.1 SDR family oxidoreductase [Alphaproteobacteria bacterium]
MRYNIPKTLFNSRLNATYAIVCKWGFSQVFQEIISRNQEAGMHVVIQGAGRGIGYAMAKQAIATGATKLFLTARQPADTKAFADLAPAENLHWVGMDFLNPATITTAASDILERITRIDRLVMVAGVLQDDVVRPEKRLADLNPAALHHSYQVNAIGPMMFVKSLWPALRQSHPVVVASISARVGSIADNRLGGWYGYRASKAALNQLSHTAAIELTRYNPQSCMVTLHPGTVDTELSRPFQKMVPTGGLFTAAQSAAHLWQVMDNLTPSQTGGFFAYDGSSIAF